MPEEAQHRSGHRHRHHCGADPDHAGATDHPRLGYQANGGSSTGVTGSTDVSAIAQLAAIPIIMAAAAIAEDLPGVRRNGWNTAISSFGRTAGRNEPGQTAQAQLNRIRQLRHS